MSEMVLTDAIDMMAAILTDPEVTAIVNAFMNELEDEVAEKIMKDSIDEASYDEVAVSQVKM